MSAILLVTLVEMRKEMLLLEIRIRKVENIGIRMVKKLIREDILLIQRLVTLSTITMVNECSLEVILMREVKYLLLSTLRSTTSILNSAVETLTMIEMASL